MGFNSGFKGLNETSVMKVRWFICVSVFGCWVHADPFFTI